ncbi:VAB2 (YEL005C) [Zygosaccharomyces parabailii]|uniref:ZYBA0S12-03136g1_1 n=1 Tax=Zygosaccharomyces bailii (strain CLIB 213 / ATCC 58445 / CBS 680 / BCRC 21525 / NBRC 1098 / NCYC 1416 / NRRL Y-2227) TaxID=1333698 RepID=A0A8J2XAH9_ZYGB2|nr:VAB2 (YEL005C) [Zygosaccharomyces parabailii]CDF91621.1 ZYBA0S12-03136g1_1 [Zygosaccharomyces bailii CLIB 213]CDH17272.1 uncharacterized protein ZBAI_09060 [Zygosaccharomyces bailii ISA1307]SJM86355.1 uncharacterized protein ZBIST_2801 [Zygosaccharomyces bailii]
MTVTSLRRRKNRYTFRTIEDAKAYEELKRISIIPNHKQLLEDSIFNAVGINFRQLREDIGSLYSVVERDIAIENRQIGLVELQLKNSLKRVKHAYNKVLIERDQNKSANYSSRMWEGFVEREDNVQNSVGDIENSINDILRNIIAADLRFPKKSQVLNEDVFNKQHYPILFQLMSDRMCKNPSTQPKDDSQRECHDVNNKNTKGEAQFIPPTLRKTCPPSTSTTLENISVTNIKGP